MFADALVVLYKAFLSSVKFKASIIKWKNIDTSLSDMEAFPMHYVIMCNFFECFPSLCLNVQYKAKHLKTKVLYIFDQKFTLESPK